MLNTTDGSNTTNEFPDMNIRVLMHPRLLEFIDRMNGEVSGESVTLWRASLEHTSTMQERRFHNY